MSAGAPHLAPPSEGHKTVTRSLAVVVPECAKVGDRLSFTTPAGSFSLTVPQGAIPGKNMHVSLPIPANFPPLQQLTMTNIRLNNEPIPPKIPPELLAMINEHRQRLEAHWSRFPASERHRVRALVELSPYKPQIKSDAVQQLGFWKLKRTASRVDAVAAWDPDVPRALKTESFIFGSARWQLIVQGVAKPWRTAVKNSQDLEAEQPHKDLELSVLLRRPALAAGEPSSAPMSVFTLLEVGGDRWSAWKSTSLGPGEDFHFDLGDRRYIGDWPRLHESVLEVTLSLTAITPGAIGKQHGGVFGKDALKAPSVLPPPAPIAAQPQSSVIPAHHAAMAQHAAAQHAAQQQQVHMTTAQQAAAHQAAAQHAAAQHAAQQAAQQQAAAQAAAKQAAAQQVVPQQNVPQQSVTQSGLMGSQPQYLPG